MIDIVRRGWRVVAAAVVSALLVVGLGLATNSLDTTRFSWDFRYYIRMAQSPFAAPMASPFAYRYGTPLLVYGISNVLGVGIEAGFRAVAYSGAILQLLAVFLFVRWFTRSAKGAWIALLVTGFSLFNVKFLLFDIYRPDHIAYALIIMQTYFAIERRFWPLLVSTLVACQFREFNVIPLVAYLFSLSVASRESSGPRGTRRLLVETLISTLGLAVAIGVPRLVIPVAEDFQFASLTRDGILRVLLAPFVLPRDANFVYSVVAYLLPSLMIAGTKDAAAAFAAIGAPVGRYLIIYGGLVLILSFLGGTDFYRFSSYLFLPQAIFVGLVSKRSPALPLVAVLSAAFLFNRLWQPFPMSDVGTYLDFYGGFGTRFGWPSVLRFLECLGFVGLGILIRSLAGRAGARPSPAAA